MPSPMVVACGQGGISPAASFLSGALGSINKSLQKPPPGSSSSGRQPALPPPPRHPLLSLFPRGPLAEPAMVFLDSEHKLSGLLPACLSRSHTVMSHTGFGGNWSRGFHSCAAAPGGAPGAAPAKSTGLPRSRSVPPPAPPSKPGWDTSLQPTRRVVESSAGTLLDRAMASVHDVARHRAAPPAFLVCHSLTGGTGAGFTSRLLSHMADE